MSEYASPRVRRVAKPMLEVLAGIPTVVYGFFAAITVAPIIVDAGRRLGLQPSFENALAPGVVMGVMIIPFMSSLCDDVISSVPQNLRLAAFSLGAMRSEVIKRTVLPAALPGIVSAFLLSVSRAIGETMIVVMAAGIAANLTPLPWRQMSTVTVHIVYNLTGDLAYDNPQTLSAFSLGLSLLIVTLILNVISVIVIRKFRQRYEGD
jgi:phosphate transport system permease protein